MKYKPTQEEFEKTIKDHSIEIVKDDGLHRHIKASNNGSFNGHFHITTWPGYLCISGDMGCYVFRRLDDMFQFFENDGINPDYWREKLQTKGEVMEFSPQIFEEALRSSLYCIMDDEDINLHFDEVWESIEEDVLGAETEQDAHRYAAEWVFYYEAETTGKVRPLSFSDFWEHNLKAYTYRFIWCCRAIVWALNEYRQQEGKSKK